MLCVVILEMSFCDTIYFPFRPTSFITHKTEWRGRETLTTPVPKSFGAHIGERTLQYLGLKALYTRTTKVRKLLTCSAWVHALYCAHGVTDYVSRPLRFFCDQLNGRLQLQFAMYHVTPEYSRGEGHQLPNP